jgi:hypothetical protein
LALLATLLDVNLIRMLGNVFMRRHGGSERLACTRTGYAGERAVTSEGPPRAFPCAFKEGPED